MTIEVEVEIDLNRMDRMDMDVVDIGMDLDYYLDY